MQAQKIDDHRNMFDSLDIEIYGLVIIAPLELEGVIEKIAEGCGGQEGLSAGPVGNVEGPFGVSTGRNRVCRVVVAEDMLDRAAVDAVTYFDALLGIDEKALATDRTANTGGEPGWLA
jgi:hypothetical protein